MTVVKHVDLEVYQQNLRTINDVVKPARVMAVVKADAYGHGLIECAKAAERTGIDILGVLDVETGLKLRKAGIEAPVFAWLHSPNTNFALAVRAGIELSVASIPELEAIAAVPGTAKVHLKIDTGLSRNGCRPENWIELVTRAKALEKIGEIEFAAVWSHLAGASRADDLASIEVFETAVAGARSLGFTGYLHIASSPAAFSIPESRYDLVRIGVSAFGTSPIEGVEAKTLGLFSPMTLSAEIIQPGIISIGFLHGFFSSLEGKASVLVNGKKFRVLKVGPLASAIEPGDYEVGDLVTVFGDEPGAASAEEICELAGTVTDELFTGLKVNSTIHSV